MTVLVGLLLAVPVAMMSIGKYIEMHYYTLCASIIPFTILLNGYKSHIFYVFTCRSIIIPYPSASNYISRSTKALHVAHIFTLATDFP